ncbi:hypothetical protein ACFVXC_05565 [Streptomyces sp. NPDC058257]|uniref:hypothetical protein n=1 Tax=Streptomyces sp. NPDC058257 TaxID=3346409 RepID=UPI0036E43F40
MGTDYQGRINLRGDRDSVKTRQNAPHKRHTGKNLRAPKRYVVSGKPAGFGNSPTYSPGAFARGMGHSDNSGYALPDTPQELAPEFDLTTLDGLRAARDHALTRARAAEARGNLVAARYARSDAKGYRTAIRTMERKGQK